MTDMQEQDPIDQIAQAMVEEIEQAEEKDKELEEVYVDLEDSTPYVEQENEVEKERKKGNSHKRKISHLQQEKDKIEQEAHFLAQENLALRNQYEMAVSKAQTSGDAAMSHYQNSLNLEDARLTEELTKAHENADYSTIAEISRAQARLAVEKNAIDGHNLYQQQQFYQQQQQQQYYQNAYPQYPQEQQVELPEESREWVNRNPWLAEGHEDHDPGKIEEVLAYSRMLDLNLTRHGREDQIHSADYYNALDEYAQSAFGHQGQQRSRAPQSSQNLEQSFSNNSRVPVAPVRKSGSGNYNNASARNVKFSDVDKDMMKEFQRYGVTPESFAKAKIKTNQDYQKALDSGDLNSLQSWGLM